LNIGHPSTSFFSFVDGLSGTTVVATLGERSSNGTVPFEGFDARKVKLDEPIVGHWSPEGRILVIDGEVSAQQDEVLSTGAFLVIERNGTGTIEKDGARELVEGEVLITRRFLRQVPTDRRDSRQKLVSAQY
jgi:hypothetical protein